MLRRMRHGLQKKVVLATIITLLASVTVRAQDTTTLSGVISDPQGKVLPGATVTITNKATGVSRNSKTGDDG